MSEIWAKSNGVSLKEHVDHLMEAIEKIPFEKINGKIQHLNHEEFKNLLKYAIFFHDLGKVSPSFQKKLKNEEFEAEIYFSNFPNIRHNILSLFFINKEKVRKICKDKENLYAVFLSTIAFHHWRLDEKEYLLHPNKTLIDTANILLEGTGKRLEEKLKEHFKDFKFNNEKAENLISFDENLANHIKNGGNLISVDIIPPYSLYFLPERLRAKYEKGTDLNLWIFLAGFLMRADHFVSMVESEKKIELEYIEKPVEKSSVFEKLKKDKNLIDKQLWQEQLLKKYKDKNIILIAPTGIGKTEFAFAWAEGEKFFYTLPLRVATNQIFERACGYFNKENEQDEDPYIEGNVGLLHSDADLYLLDKSEISKNTSFEGETLKILDLARHFSLPVNICTGDQIFPSALKYPSYEKTYATLGYSRLVIDEVQAYDPRACAIVVKMIEDIVSLGGKFLLMTATLPEFVKNAIEEKIGNGRFEVIDIYKENNKHKIKIEDIIKHKIKIENRDISEEDVLKEIVEKSKKGKRILVILNTVKKAEEVFEKLKSKIDDNNIFIDILHSKFTLNKRKEKEKRLEEKFYNPKPKDENEPKILVATQVVEASLDIDADYLFTEICPMDSLIQRMGRVMRRVDVLTGKIKGTNHEFKYENFYEQNEPNVFVYVKHKEDNKEYLESGKGKVYEKDILVLTLGSLLMEDLEDIKNYRNQQGKSRKDYNDFIEQKKKDYLEKINSQNTPISIEEKEKQQKVGKVYDNLPKNYSNYLRTFYDTLSVLDAGYISENKEEAHDLFREIYTIPVIELDKEEELKKIIERINSLITQNKLNWTFFKKEIIAEFVINENIWKYKGKEYELEPLKNKIWEYINNTIPDDDKDEILKKLERYCMGIWLRLKEKEESGKSESYII